jgi:hypothetical protein
VRKVVMPSVVKRMSRGILRRDPKVSKELNDFLFDYSRNHDKQKMTRSMIYSKDFLQEVLPDLVREASEGFSGKRIFFLHVPKTAGTSVRASLVEAVGIPSFNLYGRSAFGLPSNLANLDYWPLWTGHANIQAFPSTHSGITIFRESRSRLLSSYRHQESYQQERTGFNEWVKTEVGIAHWYVPNPHVRQDQNVLERKFLSLEDKVWQFQEQVGTNERWKSAVSQLREGDLVNGLNLGMRRIDFASWIHESDALIDAISSITGNPIVMLETLNASKRVPDFQMERISDESMKLMNTIRMKDNLVFQIAEDRGLISRLTPEVEDLLFEKSLKELGFYVA